MPVEMARSCIGLGRVTRRAQALAALVLSTFIGPLVSAGCAKRKNSDVTLADRASTRVSNAIEIAMAASSFGSGGITGVGIITYMPGGMTTDPRGMSAIGTNHAAMPMTQRDPMTPLCGQPKTGPRPSNGFMLERWMATLDP